MPSHGSMFSRSELRRQTGPYSSAVPANLRDWSPNLQPDLVADLEDATRALGRFDQHVNATLGPSHSAASPMSAVLLRTESASSSQIEKLTVSAKNLALAELSEPSTSNASMVVGNVRAMEAALSLSTDLSSAAILKMHHALLETDRDFADHAGKFRDQLVWIGSGDAGPLRADFVPPQHELVPDAITDLLQFMFRENLPVLLQVAVAHAQFLTIHPFVDGNGRTGRALSQALLRNKGVSSHIAVPVSAGILRNRSGYFDALQAFRAGDAEPVVRLFISASIYAAESGITLIDRLALELSDSAGKLAGVRSQSAAHKVLPLLIGQPVLSVDYLVRNAGLSKMTASRAIDVLVEREILVEITGQRRNRVWQHQGVLTILDDYAEQIRRRR